MTWVKLIVVETTTNCINSEPCTYFCEHTVNMSFVNSPISHYWYYLTCTTQESDKPALCNIWLLISVGVCTDSGYSVCVREETDTRIRHWYELGRSFYLHGLTFIPSWMSNHMPSKLWNEITYPFPNFPFHSVEVWEWISKFIPNFIMGVITYPYPSLFLGYQYLTCQAYASSGLTDLKTMEQISPR